MEQEVKVNLTLTLSMNSNTFNTKKEISDFVVLVVGDAMDNQSDEIEDFYLRGVVEEIRELPTFEQLIVKEKEQVIANYSDINVDYKWWDCIFEDAKEIGFIIHEFGVYNAEVGGYFAESPEDTAKAIIKNHGLFSDTRRIADSFLSKTRGLTIKNDYYIEATSEFERNLSECYSTILHNEYEYLTSEEAIVETLVANKYTFNRETLKINN